MIPLQPGAHIHLSGIGGTAMSALAGLLQEEGYCVTGSDTEIYPPVSTLLADLGIPVFKGYKASNLVRTPHDADPRRSSEHLTSLHAALSEDSVELSPDLVVIGNALSRGNEEVETVLDRKLAYASMPEALRELFLRGRETIVVAGTHGKTTVTSLLAWIFQSAGQDPGFLIGGVPSNFSRSFRKGAGQHFILEGDEYDTAFFDKGPKFLHYRPDSVILTSVEYDHADIYSDLNAVLTAFRRLVNLVPRRGCIVAWAESETVRQCLEHSYCAVETFGLEEGDWRASGIACSGDGTTFSVDYHGKLMGRLQTSLCGEHNVMNVLAAVAMSWRYGISWDAMERAVESFRGVRRRMEVVGEEGGVVVIDDFAHHPTAIRETLRAGRARFPSRRLWALLEPRSHTLRRNVLEAQLVEALALADGVVVADVYHKEKIPEPERLKLEQVLEGLLHRGILAEVGGSADQIVEAILPRLQSGDVVIIMSNGAFGGIHQKLLQALAGRPIVDSPIVVR